jgi:hypothetical protein
MLPGAAHHAMAAISCEYEAEALLWDTADQHKAMELNVPKCFCIKNLKGTDGEIKDVMLFMSHADAIVLYSKDNKYYLKQSREAAPHELTPLEYRLTLLLHAKLTIPDKEAVRVTTGGPAER